MCHCENEDCVIMRLLGNGEVDVFRLIAKMGSGRYASIVKMGCCGNASILRKELNSKR